MNTGRKNRVVPLAAWLLATVAAFAGCETKGPAEKAGENIDKGIQDAKDAIHPPGPAEKVGREFDKATKP